MLPWIFIHGYQDKTNSRNKIVSSASMLPWIFIHGYEYGALVKVVAFAWLQCCHGFSSMDTIGFFLRSPENSQASMLPWIFIHGYVNDVVVSSVLLDSFNVAMDFHPWIRIASEEYPPEVNELQCCHGFSSMDTSISDMLIIICSPASMLPWIFIHGYLF